MILVVLKSKFNNENSGFLFKMYAPLTPLVKLIITMIMLKADNVLTLIDPLSSLISFSTGPAIFPTGSLFPLSLPSLPLFLHLPPSVHLLPLSPCILNNLFLWSMSLVLHGGGLSDLIDKGPIGADWALIKVWRIEESVGCGPFSPPEE